MLLVKIDMQPLTPSGARLSRSHRNELCTDPLPSPTCTNHGVEDEGVNITIPGHVHKADQFVLLSRSQPAKAVRRNLASPVDFEKGVCESLCMQRV